METTPPSLEKYKKSRIYTREGSLKDSREMYKSGNFRRTQKRDNQMPRYWIQSS